MSENDFKRHLFIDGYYSSQQYAYPRGVKPPKLEIMQRNRNQHGNQILQQLENIKEQFSLPLDSDIPEDAIKDDVVYVQFTSEWGYALAFQSLDNNSSKPKYKILNIQEERRIHEFLKTEEFRYHVTVMMREGGVGAFINKVEQYLKSPDENKARNQNLINNIATIQRATLETFWADSPEIPFPNFEDPIWWEVWLRKTTEKEQKLVEVIQNLELTNAKVSKSNPIFFHEHIVFMVYGSASQLSKSIMLLDNLAELRKPQETADFFLKQLNSEERFEWMEELISRTSFATGPESAIICIIDSGVNNIHPLLEGILPESHMYSAKPEDWGTYDGYEPGGHGTAVAGLSIYGDLTQALSHSEQITIYHGLESFKIFDQNDATDPSHYGSLTEMAALTTIADRQNPRVFCMAVSDKSQAFRGRPSSWSAMIDKICFGSHIPDELVQQLFFVCAGNTRINHPDEYPHTNLTSSVHDPGQSYNAITVGSYTNKTMISEPGWEALSSGGEMAPSNSTSNLWESQWPIKPDIVMEGGNLSTNGNTVLDHDSLQPLSLDSEFPEYVFKPFGDTSGSTALASKMGAELISTYPNYWPETIRALIIHSASWTPEMLSNRNIGELKEAERVSLLRTVGYGVPNIVKARECASNNLTLVAQRVIQPFIVDNNAGKYNEYHLFNLPWPTSVLENDLFSQEITLKITLSYYIDPNPGSINRRYATGFSYHSHALDFSVIKPTESLDVFKRRISGAARLDKSDYDASDEEWNIRRVRNRGSIRKDFITMPGASMANRNLIAVYPKNGWYKTRKQLNMMNSKVRYSLIVSLETDEVEADIYTPVMNLVESLVEV